MPHRHLTPPPLAYARVALNRPLGQTYTYYVPESLSEVARVGSLVAVPLRTEEATGVIVDLGGEPGTHVRIKPISRVLTAQYHLAPELLELGRWLADYYFCSLGEALAAISFIGLNEVGDKVRQALALADPARWTGEGLEHPPEGARLTEGHRRVITALLEGRNDPLPADELCEAADVGPGVLSTLLKRGWLHRVAEEVVREDDDLPAAADGRTSQPHRLTAAQEGVLGELRTALDAARYQTFLLHGVTGSGKTEIYLRIIEENLRLGRSAIVLVPEIALTPQTVDSFRGRLGQVVGVYHSRLNLGQKLDLWKRIVRREVRVVIGARSAVFSPLPALGVVIVDEEHEASYKQGETPRYHGRDVAVVRASRAGALCVLGSATPSIESLHNVREGKYRKLSLPERIGPHAPPIMTLVDMKRHMSVAAAAAAQANPGAEGPLLIAPPLHEALERCLAAGEQAVLLLNRRGFAKFLMCLACEATVTCPHCAVPMTYHRVGDRLVCHWCGERMLPPTVCPQCGAPELRRMGAGTQRAEETLAALFPQARVLRVDMDSMRRRGAFQEAWRRINNHEVDIILGTQMIAKGLHLERVTLVGVLAGDAALSLPDFRSAERTFQLLTQVAGRAGRGARPGEVLVQTFMPQHYAIDCAARLDEAAFYEREFQQRLMLRFPPYGRLVGLLLSGPAEDDVRAEAAVLGNKLKELTFRPEFKGVRVLGPTPAPLERLRDEWRWRVLVRGERVGPLHGLVREGLTAFEKVRHRAVAQLTVDVDPVDLM